MTLKNLEARIANIERLIVEHQETDTMIAAARHLDELANGLRKMAFDRLFAMNGGKDETLAAARKAAERSLPIMESKP